MCIGILKVDDTYRAMTIIIRAFVIEIPLQIQLLRSIIADTCNAHHSHCIQEAERTSRCTLHTELSTAVYRLSLIGSLRTVMYGIHIYNIPEPTVEPSALNRTIYASFSVTVRNLSGRNE
jgi:hypothetical protein